MRGCPATRYRWGADGSLTVELDPSEPARTLEATHGFGGAGLLERILAAERTCLCT